MKENENLKNKNMKLNKEIIVIRAINKVGIERFCWRADSLRWENLNNLLSLIEIELPNYYLEFEYKK